MTPREEFIRRALAALSPLFPDFEAVSLYELVTPIADMLDADYDLFEETSDPAPADGPSADAVRYDTEGAPALAVLGSFEPVRRSGLDPRADWAGSTWIGTVVEEGTFTKGDTVSVLLRQRDGFVVGCEVGPATAGKPVPQPWRCPYCEFTDDLKGNLVHHLGYVHYEPAVLAEKTTPR